LVGCKIPLTIWSSALAAAVGAHQAEHLAFLHVEADVAQRPKLGVALRSASVF
jgi:hypothetical protein